MRLAHIIVFIDACHSGAVPNGGSNDEIADALSAHQVRFTGVGYDGCQPARLGWHLDRFMQIDLPTLDGALAPDEQTQLVERLTCTG